MPGPAAGLSLYCPIDGSRVEYLFMHCPFEAFQAKPATAYLAAVRILVFKTRNAFWHELSSTRTKQARIL
jgi:hypothetical protein